MRKYSKQDRELVKKNLVFIYDKFERENGENGFGEILDCTGIAMANVDIDLAVHMVQLLEKYFAHGSKYILVLNLPGNLKELSLTVVEPMTTLKNATVFGGLPQLNQLIEEKYVLEQFVNKTV